MLYRHQARTAVILSVLVLLAGCSGVVPGDSANSQVPETRTADNANEVSSGAERNATNLTADEVIQRVEKNYSASTAYRLELHTTVNDTGSGDRIFAQNLSGAVDRRSGGPVAARYDSVVYPAEVEDGIEETEYIDTRFRYVDADLHNPPTPGGGRTNERNQSTSEQAQPTIERGEQWVKIEQTDPHTATDTRLHYLYEILTQKQGDARVVSQPSESTAKVQITVENSTIMRQRPLGAGPAFVATEANPATAVYTIDTSEGAITDVQIRGEVLVAGEGGPTGNKTVSVGFTHTAVDIETPDVGSGD